MSDEHNPPAFPLATTVDTFDFPGMSLRDWFAGQSLRLAWQGANVASAAGRVSDEETLRVAAILSYAMADAMLEARRPTPAKERVG